MAKIKKEFDLISQKLASFIDNREDILSRSQFVKLHEIENKLEDTAMELGVFWGDMEKYQMSYVQIKREVESIRGKLTQIKKEVRELQDWSTDALEKHLNKGIIG
tara:strand:+ start:319 stop:633 length:315 start_codon:yes stop_codon:yes gene_type:complete